MKFVGNERFDRFLTYQNPILQNFLSIASSTTLQKTQRNVDEITGKQCTRSNLANITHTLSSKCDAVFKQFRTQCSVLLFQARVREFQPSAPFLDALR